MPVSALSCCCCLRCRQGASPSLPMVGRCPLHELRSWSLRHSAMLTPPACPLATKLTEVAPVWSRLHSPAAFPEGTGSNGTNALAMFCFVNAPTPGSTSDNIHSHPPIRAKSSATGCCLVHSGQGGLTAPHPTGLLTRSSHSGSCGRSPARLYLGRNLCM